MFMNKFVIALEHSIYFFLITIVYSVFLIPFFPYIFSIKGFYVIVLFTLSFFMLSSIIISNISYTLVNYFMSILIRHQGLITKYICEGLECFPYFIIFGIIRILHFG